MSAGNNTNQPDDAVSGPVLVSDNLIYDLSAQRQRHLHEASVGVSPSCNDGLCVVSWRPRKPRNDAA